MDLDSLWHLRNFNLFKALSREEIKLLQDMVNTDWIKRKDPVYLPGEPTRWVYFLKKGLVKLALTSESGKSITVTLLKPGEVFGEFTTADSSNAPLEAIALKNSYLCRIPRDAFLEFIKSRSDMILSINKLLGLRMHRIESAVYDMVLLDVPARLARLLFNFSQSDAEDSPHGRLITLPLTHQEIANLIGASREMVTTVLGRFADEGLIKQVKRQLVVINPERLRLFGRHTS